MVPDIRKKDIFTAILTGGKGERLWPKSRARFPKQNLRFFGTKTVIQNTVERAEKIASRNIFIIANRESFPGTIKQLRRFRNTKTVVEPFGRNTAAATGLAALLAFRKNKNSILVAMPSDHLIGNRKKFYSIIKTAIAEAYKEEAIITLGIKPTSYESAYGYIGVVKRPSYLSPGKSCKVVKFIEKPTPAIARRLVLSGRFFWNSGIFIFKTSIMLSILKRYMPTLYRGLLHLPDIKDRCRFDRELERLYKRLKNKSLDYAILERSKDLRVIPADFEWSDIGSFNSIARLAKKDKDGNTIFGSHVGIDTEGSVIVSAPNRLVGTVGIKDLIIVVTPDAILVCDRRRAENIKKLIERIKEKKNLSKYL